MSAMKEYYRENAVYNRLYDKQLCECIVENSQYEKKLSCLIYSDINNGLLGAVILISLNSSEEKLTGGRFTKFNNELESNPVSITCLSRNTPYAFHAIVEWIINNADGAWSFHVSRVQETDKSNISQPYTITVFFENDYDAAWLRLNLP